MPKKNYVIISKGLIRLLKVFMMSIEFPFLPKKKTYFVLGRFVLSIVWWYGAGKKWGKLIK